jgi:hypothetical protein
MALEVRQRKVDVADRFELKDFVQLTIYKNE